ncbi:MAG: cytotoxic translational repressor of toxin-antitoxin stability system [Deltaproteobacteria bacterium]|nr:cytotoxic translational repressor of toxin-antitoxin stability system [Deltaproteobacteria bacterium]
MTWAVGFTRKASKQFQALPRTVQKLVSTLVEDIKRNDPIRGNRPNYGKLSDKRYHCHLKKGRPTYVAAWEILEDHIWIEVIYVGAHEKAPY